MTRSVHSTPRAPAAIGPYSQAVSAGGMLFVSGQIPVNPSTGEIVKGSIEIQAKQVLENLKNIIESAGCRMENVVKVTVYMLDLGAFAGMNGVYSSYFKANPPARATVQVARLPKDAELEMDAVAWMG